MKITSRDVKAFFVGVVVMILIELAFGWSDFVRGFKDGYRAEREKSK